MNHEMYKDLLQRMAKMSLPNIVEAMQNIESVIRRRIIILSDTRENLLQAGKISQAQEVDLEIERNYEYIEIIAGPVADWDAIIGEENVAT